MFLKVMHDGADEFLATADSDATYSVYADVVSCDFKRYPADPAKGEPMAEARLRIREPVKSASVEGFVEVEKCIILAGDAFLMNDQGRTISKFKLRGYRAGAGAPDGPNGPNANALHDEAEAMRLLKAMPYAVAASIRRTAKQAGSVSADYLIKLLDKAKVAIDA
jgi:hypothetical protein